ncbi:MarR family transcriptional regulator [Galbibacter sp. EGI 63066]|uniref:GbsR/MarR family transcriptional regulator n=1 Tax=Galbibacter sp. EGI 63066 TaxID=2993559 RepID=UPI002249A1C5|nr:MarR family transcriptional regulator [Galbibacter sp. EGI 63066]MCX2680587.1 MarR family transcriptional regulator [Galbibacter sp. EGI 63066]
MQKQKKEIIEEMGVYFECHGNLSPLSSRIFAYLVLCGEDGATFDKMLEELEMSKSSASTNLQLLQSMGRIGYYTKPGDRKRYFKISIENSINRLDEKINSWEKEKQLHQKVYRYRQEMFKMGDKPVEEYNVELSMNKHFVEFADEMIKSLEKLKNNILTTINKKQ